MPLSPDEILKLPAEVLVLLDAIKSEKGSKIEFVAVLILVHCKNLQIV